MCMIKILHSADWHLDAPLQGRSQGEFLRRELRKLPEKECCIFLRRYWYLDGAQTIARRFHMTEGSVKSQLFRTRTKLRAYLEKEGICL